MSDAEELTDLVPEEPVTVRRQAVRHRREWSRAGFPPYEAWVRGELCLSIFDRPRVPWAVRIVTAPQRIMKRWIGE